MEVDHESRDVKEFDVIAPFVRSMSVFKPYAEFDNRDFEHIFRDIKLHKIKKKSVLLMITVSKFIFV